MVRAFYSQYCSIKDLERQYSQSDIVFLVDNYGSEDERKSILTEYILSASSKIDKYMGVVDPNDPDIRNICGRLVFYQLCLRHRVVTPEILEDYNFALKELKQYSTHEVTNSGIVGQENISESFTSYNSSKIVRGGYTLNQGGF